MKQVKKNLREKSLIRPIWFNKNNDRNLKKICLDKNENNDPTLFKKYQKVFNKELKSSISYYPNLFKCYKTIASLNNVKIENILIGAGSDGIIRSIFETFVNKGDIVLKTKPTFQMYEVYSKIYQAKTIDIEYKISDNKISFDLEKFIHAVKKNKVKLICLPNPDSPTGTIVADDNIKKILSVAKAKGTIVLIDEAYFPFYNKTALKFLKKYNNLIITRTFAKAWGLAGLRIGYSISSKEVANYMHKVKSMYEVNTFAAHIIPSLLPMKNDVMKSVKKLNLSKSFFLKKLKKMGFTTLKSYGNFCHVNFGEKSVKIHKSLKKHVLYKENFSEKCLNGYSRFSLTDKNKFKKILNLISKQI